MPNLLITEIFYSIQGETSHVGLPYTFIRLTGCNLRCVYCDTPYAFHGGTKISFGDILKKVQSFPTRNVLITGGEPLMQRSVPEFISLLNKHDYSVSVETHGETSIEKVTDLARIVMDIKTPGSKMCREGFRNNLAFLKSKDEVKFVITSTDDYEWARAEVLNGKFPCEILFSPVIPGLSLKWLAEKIIEDRLPVRLQTQLHKQIWGSEARGV